MGKGQSAGPDKIRLQITRHAQRAPVLVEKLGLAPIYGWNTPQRHACV